MEKITDIAVSAPSGEDALPDFSPPSKTEIGWKKRRVKNIMKSIHKVLRRDIGEVTETALMRKSEVQLKDLEKSLKKRNLEHY